MGVRANFILKARIFAKEFSKIAPRDRNNVITDVFHFMQPSFRFLVHVLQSFFSLTDAFVSIGHANTKATEILKDLIRLCAVPINFHIM